MGDPWETQQERPRAVHDRSLAVHERSRAVHERPRAVHGRSRAVHERSLAVPGGPVYFVILLCRAFWHGNISSLLHFVISTLLDFCYFGSWGNFEF